MAANLSKMWREEGDGSWSGAKAARCHAEEDCFGDREGGAAVAVVVVEKAVAVLELALK